MARLASASLLGEGKADLAIIRGDLDVPKNAQAVATLRKNVVVLWVPVAPARPRQRSAPGSPKLASCGWDPLATVGRTRPMPNCVGNPAARRRARYSGKGRCSTAQFPPRGRRAHPQPEGRRLTRCGPVNSKITPDAYRGTAPTAARRGLLVIDPARVIARPTRLRGPRHLAGTSGKRAEPAHRGPDQDDQLPAPIWR